MLQVTYGEIARVLESAGSSVTAAESHGCLCGALCMTTDYPFERWLEEIVPDDADASVDAQSEQGLRLLFNDTLQALRGDAMEFEPLLAEDDAKLEQRARVLSHWCEGFLYGLGTGRRAQTDALPANVNEILRDLTHISRAGVDADAATEEDEEAYVEVIEYIRAGVQLIHDELSDLRYTPVASDDDPDLPQ